MASETDVYFVHWDKPGEVASRHECEKRDTRGMLELRVLKDGTNTAAALRSWGWRALRTDKASKKYFVEIGRVRHGVTRRPTPAPNT